MAKSASVSSIDDFPDCDFKAVNDWIKGQIKELTQGSNRLKNRYWLLNATHKLLDELSPHFEDIETLRRAYQVDKYGKYSMGDFSIEQLQEYYVYLIQTNPLPTFSHKKDLFIEYLAELTKEEKENRKNLLIECAEWLEKHDVSSEKQFAYLIERYGADFEFLTIPQLSEYADYLSLPNPSFDPHESLVTAESPKNQQPKSSYSNVIQIFKKSDKSVKLEINKLVEDLISELGAVPEIEQLCGTTGILKIKAATARKNYRANKYPFAYRESDSREAPILIDIRKKALIAGL